MTTKTIQFNDGGYWTIGQTIYGDQAHDMYFSFHKKCHYNYDRMIEIVTTLYDSGYTEPQTLESEFIKVANEYN